MPLKDSIARAAYQQEYQVRTGHSEKARTRYQTDPEYREQQKQYRQENKSHYADLQRQWRADHPRESLVIDARGRAKKAGIPCSIYVHDIEWPAHCPVLGVELVYMKCGGKVRSNSATLDRRTNDLGYVPGNVFVISHRANRLKSDATIAELEAILAYAKGGALTIS